MEIVRAAMNLSLDKLFDYLVPPHLSGKIRPGMKINVPFGRGSSLRQAYVVSLTDQTAFSSLKNVDSVCENFPAIPDALIRLAEWMSVYYCCPRELALRNLLPGAVRSGKVKPKTKKYYRIAEHAKAAEYIAANPNARAESKRKVLQTLMLEHELSMDMLLLKSGAVRGAVETLVKLGLVTVEILEERRDPFKGAKVVRTEPLPPTAEQRDALERIYRSMKSPDGPHTVLLQGVTCSGKTEVYLQAIARTMETGGDAIVLVPEISLTPQTVERFRARFGDMVSVLHSGLSDGERYDEWMKVHSGSVRIAVGARSALFAPFKHLKLIVVDEEHEQSYKQSETPRYNARDVAVMRGKLEHAAVILGSATPSLESYRNALEGRYGWAKMPSRRDPSILMPEIRIVDMREESMDDGRLPFLSKALVSAVRDRIALGEQSIIFLNRRGFAKQMTCEVCGYTACCPSCSTAYTYHKKNKILSCHLCGSMINAPEACPSCGSPEIRYSGAGTERIENMAFAAFSDARIARMDSDSMTRPGLYEEVLGKFRVGRIDILIGTQMIAKGLDFPNVTFVGVVNADMGLFLPDFRAAERTFQLLTQVSGRAGRGETKGEVMIQTCNPFNPAILAAANNNFSEFYDDEMAVRKELNFPPFGHLLTLNFSGPDSGKTLAYAAAMMERLKPFLDPETIVTEVAPAPIERINGRFRFVSVFRSGKFGRLKPALRTETFRRHPDGIQVFADIDPMSMM